jgi:hypothetical protein
MGSLDIEKKHLPQEIRNRGFVGRLFGKYTPYAVSGKLVKTTPELHHLIVDYLGQLPVIRAYGGVGTPHAQEQSRNLTTAGGIFSSTSNLIMGQPPRRAQIQHLGSDLQHNAGKPRYPP